jgi:mono/diheme cytochrome c family protein
MMDCWVFGNRRQLSAVRTVVALVLLALLGAGIPGRVEAQETLALPDDPLVGRTLFEAKHCLECHGLTGEDARIGPGLDGARFSGTFLELGAALWNHVPGMSVTMETAGLPWPQLTPQDS